MTLTIIVFLFIGFLILSIVYLFIMVGEQQISINILSGKISALELKIEKIENIDKDPPTPSPETLAKIYKTEITEIDQISINAGDINVSGDGIVDVDRSIEKKVEMFRRLPI